MQIQIVPMTLSDKSTAFDVVLTQGKNEIRLGALNHAGALKLQNILIREINTRSTEDAHE